jgi:protein-S-isoprenylcysteine O-methyltransferase Ste14
VSGQVSRELAVRTGVLYVPVLAALFAGVLLPRRRRMFAACLLSVLWVLPALVVLQRLNEASAWWGFAGGGPALRGMPLEVWFGWTVLWGLVPQLAMPRMKLRWCALGMVSLDIATMPLCAPLVVLGPRWLAGEAVAVALVLVPALCVARWTLENTHLGWRTTTQVATAGLVFLYLSPEIAFALRPGAGWAPLLSLHGWQAELAGLGVFVTALPGLAAVQEFVERGQGTPIPYDPPQRLVVSGIYRYCANPMQLGCALTMLACAGLLRNAWLVVPAAISVVYSAGIAEWDERRDLEERFGRAFEAYRREAPNWRLRVLPYVGASTGKIYIAATCGPCSELRMWLERRTPAGLEMVKAETLCAGSIRRLRYVAADGTTEHGVKALGRALEHIHVGWALTGAVVRLPVVSVLLQALMDASGFGPRELRPNHFAADQAGNPMQSECRYGRPATRSSSSSFRR